MRIFNAAIVFLVVSLFCACSHRHPHFDVVEQNVVVDQGLPTVVAPPAGSIVRVVFKTNSGELKELVGSIVNIVDISFILIVENQNNTIFWFQVEDFEILSLPENTPQDDPDYESDGDDEEEDYIDKRCVYKGNLWHLRWFRKFYKRCIKTGTPVIKLVIKKNRIKIVLICRDIYNR